MSNNLELINIGSAPGDETGDPIRTAYGKCNANTNYLEEMLQRTRSFNGFDREDQTTLGIIQYCHNAVSGEIHNIDQEGEYTLLTGQSYYADGTTALVDRTIAQYKTSGQSDFKFWYQGALHQYDTIKTFQLPNDSDTYFVVYDVNGGLKVATDTREAIVEEVLLALIAQNATTGELNYLADERHGIVMDGQTHLRMHSGKNSGYAWMGGFNISGLANNGTTFSSIAEGYSGDEDIKMVVDALNMVPHLYRLGASGEYTYSPYSSGLGFFDGGKCVYNEFDGSIWKLSEIGSDYVNMTLFQSNNKLHPHFWAVGQSLHTDRGTARDHLMANVTELQLDTIISPETFPLYSCIIHKEDKGQIEVGAEGEVYIDHRWGYPVMRF